MNILRYLQPVLGFVFLLQSALAQIGPVDPVGFNWIGRISAMTLNAGTNPLRGGTVTVNGIKMTVPDNTLATLPSTSVAWPELFNADGSPNLPQFGTESWSTTIFGNIFGDQYLVGLVYIAQDQFQVLSGYIQSFNPDGSFIVGGNKNGQANDGFHLVINDPTGVYSPAYTANPLWSVDPVNPSVRATTGFPVCIPKSATDPTCPAKNRPNDATGKPATAIQFKAPGTLAPTDPDPTLMVPLVVGDFITFSATNVGGGLLAVYNLAANIAAYTAPGTLPAYINCDALNFGVSDAQGGEVAETRAEAFSTDINTPVQWFAMDEDPCTGNVTERNLLLVQPFAAAPSGKITYRLGNVDASPPTRQVGFRSQLGTSAGPNGIIAGQFVQPTFNFIFPELINIGAPMLFDSFDQLHFLRDGHGPYTPGNPLTPPQTTGNLPIVGQLSPWPGAAAPPTAPVCPPIPAGQVQPPPASSSVAPPTSSSSAPPAASSSAAPDVVKITGVTTTKSVGGITPVTVTATSSDTTGAQTLSLSITGNQNLAPVKMNNLGGGNYQLEVSVKGPKTVTVTSTGGGSATTAA